MVVGPLYLPRRGRYNPRNYTSPCAPLRRGAPTTFTGSQSFTKVNGFGVPRKVLGYVNTAGGMYHDVTSTVVAAEYNMGAAAAA